MSVDNNTDNNENDSTEFLRSLVKKLDTMRSPKARSVFPSSIQSTHNVSPIAGLQDDWLRLVKSDKLDIEQRLFIAILLNAKDTVRDLLKVGADPNALNMQDTTPLQLALAFGRVDIAKILCDYGARPRVSGGASKSHKT